jgi:FkbM family methyltransferase
MTQTRAVSRPTSRETHWYEDADLVASLPFWLRIYAAYSRGVGDRTSRRVRGGSFLLRTLQRLMSRAPGSHIATVRARRDMRICVDVCDERLLEVLYEARSQNAEQLALASLLRDGDTFIDVGANHGTFSLVAARFVGQSGRVVAIEPQPRLAELIRRSAQLNELSNLEVHEFAAGSRGGTAELYVPRRDSGRAGLHRAFSGKATHETLRVCIERIDTAIDWRHLPGNVVIKIDVEGAERDVIDGGTDLLNGRDAALIIEVNPWSARAAGYTVEQLLDSLTSKGFDSIMTVGRAAGLSDEAISTDRQQNIIARRAITDLRSDGILTDSAAPTSGTNLIHESSRSLA